MSRRPLVASLSVAGSYQALVQTTWTLTSGLTARTPSTKALVMRITSGMGMGATYPMRFFCVIVPATRPLR